MLGLTRQIFQPGHIVGPGWAPINPQAHAKVEVFSRMARDEELTLAQVLRTANAPNPLYTGSSLTLKVCGCWQFATSVSWTIRNKVLDLEELAIASRSITIQPDANQGT